MNATDMEVNFDMASVLFGPFAKIAKSDYYLRHVCPSVRTKQLGSQLKDFHEVLYLNIFF